jgi:hypothetical protein
MNKNRDTKIYANFVSMIQSSGFGKSRLADEIARLILSVLEPSRMVSYPLL